MTLVLLHYANLLLPTQTEQDLKVWRDGTMRLARHQEFIIVTSTKLASKFTWQIIRRKEHSPDLDDEPGLVQLFGFVAPTQTELDAREGEMGMIWGGVCLSFGLVVARVGFFFFLMTLKGWPKKSPKKSSRLGGTLIVLAEFSKFLCAAVPPSENPKIRRSRLTVWAGQAFTPVAWTVGRFEFGEIFGIEFAKFWSGVKFAYLEPTWPFFRRSCGEIWIFSTGETLKSRPNGTVGCIFHVEYFYRGRVTESQPGKHGRKSRWFFTISPSPHSKKASAAAKPRRSRLYGNGECY